MSVNMLGQEIRKPYTYISITKIDLSHPCPDERETMNDYPLWQGNIYTYDAVFD